MKMTFYVAAAVLTILSSAISRSLASANDIVIGNSCNVNHNTSRKLLFTLMPLGSANAQILNTCI